MARNGEEESREMAAKMAKSEKKHKGGINGINQHGGKIIMA